MIFSQGDIVLGVSDLLILSQSWCSLSRISWISFQFNFDWSALSSHFLLPFPQADPLACCTAEEQWEIPRETFLPRFDSGAAPGWVEFTGGDPGQPGLLKQWEAAESAELCVGYSTIQVALLRVLVEIKVWDEIRILSLTAHTHTHTRTPGPHPLSTHKPPLLGGAEEMGASLHVKTQQSSLLSCLQVSSWLEPSCSIQTSLQ